MKWKVFNIQLTFSTEAELNNYQKRLHADHEEIAMLLSRSWKILMSHVYTSGGQQFIYVFMSWIN